MLEISFADSETDSLFKKDSLRRIKVELVYKPDSVKDDHLSRYYVAIIF